MDFTKDLVTRLRKKKIKVIEITGWGTYLRKEWEKNFTNHLGEYEKNSIYLSDFLWHVFSYEKRNCLKEEQANNALKNEIKKACYIFYQRSNEAFLLENAKALNAEDFINEEDIYVVDKEFTWTYVKTHETGWLGPYFSRN